MERRGSRRVVLLAVGLLALCAAVAVLARLRLDRLHPPGPADWWKPRAVAPTLDPELLARAARDRRQLTEELAERRARLRPVPERLRDATAVPQLGHAGPITGLAWAGADVLTTGEDGTLRRWRFDGRRLRELRALALPARAAGVAAVPDGGRVWAFVPPDRLVTREGAQLEVERVRRLPPGFLRGLAVADAGQHVVLLLGRTADDGSTALAVRHYLEPETVLLKEVPLEVVRPLAAALAPDGERVAVLVPAAAGPSVELRSAADGGLQWAAPLVVPWWTAETPGPHGAVTLGIGADFVVLADAGGTLVVPLDGAGVPGAPLPFPHDAAAPGVSRVCAVCDGAAVVDGPAGASVLRRTAGGWRAEPVGPSAWPATCTAGGTVVALARDDRLEVRSPSGADATTPAAVLSGALLIDGGARVELLRAAARWTTSRTSFDLAGFTTSRTEVAGTVLAVDPAAGELLLVSADELRLESPSGSSRFAAADGARPVALRAGVVASLGALDRRVVLQERTGATLGAWPVPEWLGAPRVSVCVDGRTVVAGGSGGFVVWRVGAVEPLLYFPGEGYEQAPAEVSPDGRLVLLGRNDGTVESWSLESWEVERSQFAINEQGGRPTVLRWSVDGEALLVGGTRGGVVALQARTGNPLWADVLHEGPVTVLEPATAGPWVLSADGRTAVLSAAKGGERLLRLALGTDESWVAYTVDGYHAAGGPGGERLLALRRQTPGTEPGKFEWTVVGAEGEDFAALGGAVDALRVTLLGASSSGEEE